MEKKNQKSQDKIIFNKRLHLLKQNCFFLENKTVSECENLTFREKNENIESNKENNSNLNNLTAKKDPFNNKDKQFSSFNQDKYEKETPGFHKFQNKINEKQDKNEILNEIINNSQQKQKIKKNKKTSSCFWDSYSIIKADIEENTSIELQKSEKNSYGRKLKIPTNQFWKKFIGKSEKIDFKDFKPFKKNENDEIKNDYKNNFDDLVKRVNLLEKNLDEKNIKIEKLFKKCKKLKDKNEILEKTVENLSKNVEKDIFSIENISKSVNDFEYLLKKSLFSSNCDLKSKRSNIKNAGYFYEALKFFEKTILPIRDKCKQNNYITIEDRKNIENMREMIDRINKI